MQNYPHKFLQSPFRQSDVFYIKMLLNSRLGYLSKQIIIAGLPAGSFRVDFQLFKKP